MRSLPALVIIISFSGMLHAQGRIVLNGGRVNITNGGVVVLANSASNAITRTSGYFISEGQNNRVKWNIGTTAGARTIPWGTSAGAYIPVTFTPSAATGATGYFYFATYATTAQNSLNLPTGVTHFNSAVGLDASLTAVDRFWKVDAQSYTVRPTLTNLIFSYPDAEYASPNKTAIENKLTTRRWNSTLSTWQDYVTGGVVNTTGNTVTIASLPAAQLLTWWSIEYPAAAYHWISTTTGNANSSANWSATAGGTGGLGVPAAGDAVFFDDVRDGNATINTSVDVGAVTVATGYSGTITQGASTINVDGDAVFSSGTFSGGAATMTVNGNLSVSGTAFTAPTLLDVKGNFIVTGAGTFAHNTGTVRFSGAGGTQTINAPSVVFRSINVTNNTATPGVIFESNNQLAGVLTLANDVSVDPDGAANNRTLTLLSTADNPTADAAVGILPSGASVNGRVTVQRHMTIEGSGGGRIYRYIASPISNATVADIQGEISVTGSFTGTSSCTGCGTAQSMFAYDETVVNDLNGSGTANYDDGYVDFPQNTNTEILAPGRGYTLFVRGNIMTSARWDVRGNINAGNVTPISFPVSYTSSGVAANDGWNLVGNPFPSTIDWNAASGWTKTNINAAIYTRDNAVGGGQFSAWNGVVGTNGGSRYIAMGQAFWVKAGAATPALSATENIKVPGTQAVFFREESPRNLIRITLHQGNNRDEAVVHFRTDATNDFDDHADAEKLPNSGFGFSTQFHEGKKLAINSLDLASCSTSINLVMDNTAKGTYSLSFEDANTFAASTTLTLTDAFTGTTVDVREAGSYAFSVTADPASFNNTRFTMTVVQQPVPMDFALAPVAVCEGLDSYIQMDNASSQNIYEVFVNDSILWSDDGMDGSMKFDVPSRLLHTGDNNVIVRATPQTGCASFIEKESVLVVHPIVTPQHVSSGFVCREGEVTLTATGATEGQQYNWYEEENDVTPLNTGSEAFTTPVINKSRTYYVALANALGCEGDRLPVMAEVVQYDDPIILLSNDSLFTNYSGPKQWYLDGELLAGDTLSFTTPQRTGVYTVSIPVQQCKATASFAYTLPDITTGVTPETTSLYLYPNPVSQFLYFSQENSAVDEVIIQNASGQPIGVLPLTRKNNVTTGRFDMSGVASGLYIIQLRGKNERREVKVVKE